jgi:hypothetical protein
MYEYLSPGAVRRTFTDGNLSAINTAADRFMKAELPVAVAQAVSDLGRQEMGDGAVAGGQVKEVVPVAVAAIGQASTDLVLPGRNSNAAGLEPSLSVAAPVASFSTGNGQPGSGGGEVAVVADQARVAAQASWESARPAPVGSAQRPDHVSDAALVLFFAPSRQGEASLSAAPVGLDGLSVQQGDESGDELSGGTADLVGAGTVAAGLFAGCWYGWSGQAAPRQQRRWWL